MRAFLAGRLDLLQAEAVLGVIDARAPEELSAALDRMAGGAGAGLSRSRAALLDLLADVEDVCDRIAVLHQGELKELGRVEDLLRVTDVTQIRARNLPAAAVAEVRSVLERHGVSGIEIGNPTTTLEDLFLEVVRDTEARPGRRARRDAPADRDGRL